MSACLRSRRIGSAFTMKKLIINILMLLVLAKESISLAVENTVTLGRTSTLRSDATSNDDKTIIAAKGETVVMQCDFRVPGWFTVQWIKLPNAVQQEVKIPVVLPVGIISSNGSLSSVTVESIEENDAGNYSCILSSLSGSKTYKFQVLVKDKRSCEENTCSPNGHCSEVTDGYDCKCKPGFTGTHCELKDPCSDSPCQNNGSCIATGEEFSCSCVQGYGGSVCESEVCTPNVCGSDGTCRVKNGRIRCSCAYNKAGDRCQYRCNFNGRRSYCSYYSITCKISINGYRQSENCVCDNSRRSGNSRCMMQSDVRNECRDRNICNGQGSCYDQIFGYRCDCNRYTSGTNCEFVNECHTSNLCSTNGGTCVDLDDGYKCTNCPDGQHGDKCQYKKDPCKVTCSGSTMTASCDLRFLSTKIRTIPIYLNEKTESCRVSRYHSYGSSVRRITVSYTACGTETEYGDDYVVYRNYMRVGNSGKQLDVFDSIITRAVGHFTFKMECTLPLVRNATATLNDLSLMSNETMDLQDRKNIGVTGTNIQIFKDNYYSRPISSYVVGDRLYVKMTINTDSNPTLSRGYKLHPVTCYATPDREGGGERYMLLEKGCVMDETFRIENGSDQREGRFSFDSFSFKSNPGKLYLHCISLACDVRKTRSLSREDCDVTCNNSDASTIAPGLAAINTIERVSASSVEIFTTKSPVVNLP